MKCPDCGKETVYEEYDCLAGFGPTEYTDKCECGYFFHYAYGQYEIHQGGKDYEFYYFDAEKIANGQATIADYEVNR